MITISVIKGNDQIKSLTITGHALSGDPGFDLVCAGVSSIAIGALNGLDYLNSECELEMTEEPLVSIKCKLINETNQLLLQFLLVQLETISESYNNYIEINIKEESQ